MSRILWAFVGLSVASIAGAAIFGDERQLGAAVAVAVVVCAVGYGLTPLFRKATNKVAIAIVVGSGALAAGCALLPIFEGLGLGDAIARAELSKVGDAMALPQSASGPLRVLVHVPPPTEEARIHVELQGGDTTLSAQLDSNMTTVRLGRRGHGQRLVQNDSQFIDTVLPSGVSSLSLKNVSGPLKGPVTVEVYREWVADWSLIALAGVLVLGLAAVGAMSGAGTSPAGGIACAVVFGLMAHRSVTPEHAVRPEMGALFVALVVGAFGGAVLTLMIERLMISRTARATSTAA